MRGTYVQMVLEPDPVDPHEGLIRGSELSQLAVERHPSGFAFLDHVLGGGFALGCSYCCAGEPGIGKSTLATQVAARVTPSLYVAGEEGAYGLRERAGRLGALPDDFFITPETRLDRILAYIAEGDFQLVVVDSIQTLHALEVSGRPGSPSQLVACTLALHTLAHQTDTIVWMLCHVTKDGDPAGPKAIEHLVDCMMMVESLEGVEACRGIQTSKNRLGPAPLRSIAGVTETGAWSDAVTRPPSTSASASSRRPTRP